MAIDLLSVGDVTVDTFLFINDAHVECSLDKKACQLCVNYADKLPVERLERLAAGNAANNAVGATRLGMKAVLVCSIGKDASGEMIRREMRGEGVDTRLITVQPRSQTNASTVLSFKGERTIFVYHAPRKYALPAKTPTARAMYYTSVGEHHEKLNRDVVTYIKKTGALLGFNPGTYQLRSAAAALKSVLAVTGILFVNKEEAARIIGRGGEIKEQLAALHQLGAKIVVITDGPSGSFVFDGEHFYTMGIPDTPIVERTGAGDAFASAFLVARMRGKSVPDAMCWGTMNASSVIMYVGPQAGLLRASAIVAFHKKHKHVCAIKF